jgi:hypothetical protein
MPCCNQAASQHGRCACTACCVHVTVLPGSLASRSLSTLLLAVQCRGADPFYGDDLGEPRLDQGWEVVAANTSPSVGPVCSAKIHFGEHNTSLSVGPACSAKIHFGKAACSFSWQAHRATCALKQSAQDEVQDAATGGLLDDTAKSWCFPSGSACMTHCMTSSTSSE